MTYEFAKYPDGTLGVFSNNGNQFMQVMWNSIANKKTECR